MEPTTGEEAHNEYSGVTGILTMALHDTQEFNNNLG